TPDGEGLAWYDRRRRKVVLRTLRSGEERTIATDLDPGTWSPAISGDGKTLAIVALDQAVRVYDVASGKELQRPAGKDRARCVALSPDGKTLAVGTDEGYVQVWERPARAFRFSTRLHPEAIVDLAFSADGQEVVFVDDLPSTAVINAETGRRLGRQA